MKFFEILLGGGEVGLGLENNTVAIMLLLGSEENKPCDVKWVEFGRQMPHRFQSKSKEECPTCHETFHSKSIKKRHKKNLEAFVAVFCKPCGYFMGLDESRFHHTLTAFCMSCRQCLPVDRYENHLCFHKKALQMLANETRRFCRYCKQMFFWPKDVEVHEKYCYNPDLINLFCKCCKMRFSNRGEMESHVSLLNSLRDKAKNVCIFCDIKFETVNSLGEHMKALHSKYLVLPEIPNLKARKKRGEPRMKTFLTKIPCRFCDLTFKNKNWVISHERKQHASELIKCDICSASVKMEQAKAHYVSHRLQEKYKNTPEKICNVCGVKVKNLDSHMVRHEDERKYKCHQCFKTFKLQWDLKRHMLVHTSEAKHICQICGKGFKVGYNLNVHMRSHELIKPFPCLVCDKTFTTKQWRDSHVKSHHRINIKENSCNVCNKQFQTVELRDDHLKNIQTFLLVYCKACGFIGSARDSSKHHDYFFFCAVCKTFIFEHFWDHECLHQKWVQEIAVRSRKSCEICQEDLFSELDATNHVCDTEEEGYICKCCREEFSDRDYLGFHLNFFKKPENVSEFYCVICKQHFENLDRYKDHTLQMHLNSALKIFKNNLSKIHCKFCNLQFANKNIATAHERKQHGNELVECPLCFKQLRIDKMKGHNTTHRTQKCYRNSLVKICNICGISVKNLQRHLITHRNERQYKCSLCSKDFKLAWDMKKHMKTHFGEAKYKCAVCGKGFKVAYNLKVHMRIHEDVKPFSCLVCEKTFTTKQSRDIHLKIHDRMTLFSI